MKKRIPNFIWVIILTGCHHAVQGQVSFGNLDRSGVVSFSTKSTSTINVEAKGSPYLEEEFQAGEIIVEDKKINQYLRYNAYSREIEIQQGPKNFTALLKRPEFKARINDRLYEIRNYINEDGQVRNTYMVSLVKGKYELLFKPIKRLKRGRSGSTSYDRSYPPQFIDISEYAVSIDGEPAIGLPLRKKDLKKVLKDEKVEDLIKSNKLKIKVEEDLIRLFVLLNQ